MRFKLRELLNCISPKTKDSNMVTYQHARVLLSSWSPKPTGRCYTERKERILYDLQIVIPAFNVERYIRRCLDSLKPLLNSKYRVLIQIVDDGSTDRTGDIAKEFAEEALGDIIVLHHQNNKGLAAARNTALSTIYGNYVLLIDSDDFLPAEFNIDSLMGIIEGCDILQGCCFTVDQNELMIDRVKRPTGYAWGKLYHHCVFKNFQFPEGYWFEDTPVKFILFNKGLSIEYTNHSVYCYRKNPNGITAIAERFPKSIDTYWITELCIEELSVFGIEYNQKMLDCFLQQTILNQKRIRKQPASIRKAVFILTTELIEKYFSGVHTSTYKRIERAIRCSQFLRFELLVYHLFFQTKLSMMLAGTVPSDMSLPSESTDRAVMTCSQLTKKRENNEM